MTKYRFYGNRTPEITPLEKENRLLAREIASEGAILLKNDGTLPLKDKKIALYGNGARMTVKGGSGSGDARERYSVNIEEGLINEGVTILSDKWLDRFSNDFKEKERIFKENIEKNIKKYNIFQTMQMFIYIGEQHLDYPTAFKIEDDELVKDSDTCIYVLSRQAGEGKDRELKKGDYYLTDVEIYNINLCAKTYKYFVLLINSGSVIDLTPIIDNNDINSILYISLPGEDGGNAIASIIYGKVTPSGKLPFTWGKKYEDYPSFDTFSYNRKNKYEDEYKEGVFVGYRHFNKKNITPLFNFGYGLSYANFKIDFKKYKVDKSKVSLLFTCLNESTKYKGKEVIEIYLSKLNTTFNNPNYELVAIKKTKLLNENEKEEVSLNFDLADFSNFDILKESYLLAKGNYVLSYLDTKLNKLVPFLNIEIENDLTVESVKSLNFKTTILENDYDDKFSIDLEKLNKTKINEISDDESNDNNKSIDFNKYKNITDKLTNKELIKLVVGGGYSGKYFNRVAGSCGRTTSDLIKKSIPNLTMSDGPAGINIVQKIAYTKSGGTRYLDELPKDWQWGWIKKYGKLFITNSKNVNRVYNYTTAFPCESMLASTFNSELAYKEGVAVGKEMHNFGIAYWLSPGVNIQRNPLCGRNFEYYSEDPLLSAIMASSLTNGVQNENSGVGVTVKHFCCNNEENYRTDVNVNINERAFREIYLNVYKRIIKWSHPKAIMGSYNKVNGEYVVNSKKLLNDFLRDELHFDGLIMTDWNATDKCSNSLGLKNGMNLIMPGNVRIKKELLNEIKNKKITRNDLLKNAFYVLDAIFNSEINKDFKEGL